MRNVQDALLRAAQAVDGGNLNLASELAQDILVGDPLNAAAMHVMAIVLRRFNQPQQALKMLNQAIGLDPNQAGLYFESATVLNQLGQYDKALEHYERSAQLQPELQAAFVNRGAILEQQERLDEALVQCREAIRLNSGCALAQFNCGNVLRGLGRLDEAIAAFARAVALQPGFAKAHWNSACCHLLRGDLVAGWQEYQWREAAEEVVLDRYSQPLWQGESLAGKTLLVHAEQGLGDEILFASCLPDLIAQAKQCVIVCEPRLATIFARSFPAAAVLGYARRKDRAPAAIASKIDFQIPAGSVPQHFRRSPSDFPQRKRYLLADPAARTQWRRRFDQLGPGLKVGISWRAGGQPVDRRRRTTVLDQWQPLFALAGVHFINLQYGDCVDDLAGARARLGVQIHDWPDADPLVDFEGFAAKVAALDLVISVGNATVHAAGALGTPAWGLLPLVPGWRWGISGEQSLWYPSVQLIRQTTRGDWEPVFAQAAEWLRRRLGSTTANTAVPRATRPMVAAPLVTESAPAAPNNLLRLTEVAQSFDSAVEAFGKGNLPQAEKVCRELLDHSPRHINALHLLGVIAKNTGRVDLAIRSISRALAVSDSQPVIHVNMAEALIDAGRVDQAIEHFQRAIALDASLVEPHLGLAGILLQAGRADEARQSFQRALATKPDCHKTHNIVGARLLESQQYNDAIASFRRAIKLKPDYTAAHNNLGRALQVCGQLEEAARSFQRTLELDDTCFQAANNLAAVYEQLGQPVAAARLFRRALALRPNEPSILSSLQAVLAKLSQTGQPTEELQQNLVELQTHFPLPKPKAPVEGSIGPAPAAAGRKISPAKLQQMTEAAVNHYNADQCAESDRLAREIHEYDPNHTVALRLLGMSARKGKDFEVSLAYFNRALEIEPANGILHFELGLTYSEMCRQREAYNQYLKAIHFKPNLQAAYVNLSAVMETQERYEETVQWARKSLALRESCGSSHYNLANALRELGQLDQAVVHYTRAVELKPEYIKASWNLGICHLHLGNFAEGWRLFEVRDLAQEVFFDRFNEPRWKGEPLADKTIVVHAEQGIGDEILFASCFPDVIAAAKHCIMICDPRLQDLFARSFPDATVYGFARRKDWSPPPIPRQFDVQIPAGSLPLHFRSSRESFPQRRQFLVPDESLKARWRKRFDALGPGLKVGISWRAGGKPNERRKRTIDLEQLAPLLAVPGVQFINLQYSDSSDDIAALRDKLGLVIHDWEQGDPLVDMDAYAAKVAALDLVISVGNATVHMAGALGVEAWTMLPMVPSWRWMVSGEESPWYPSVRLYRRKRQGTWQPVIARLTRQLCERVGADPEQILKDANLAPTEDIDTSITDEPRWLGAVEVSADVMVDSIETSLAEAEQCHAAGNLERAEALYRGILQIAPRHLKALHGLGLIAHATGRLELAIRSLQRAEASFEPYAPVHYDLALVLIAAERFAEAAAHCERAIALDPALPGAQVTLGVILQSQGQHVRAIDQFSKAVELCSDDAMAWLHLGQSQRALCQLDSALGSLARAVKLRPDLAIIHHVIGQCYVEDQCYADAERSFRRALDLEPNNLEAMQSLASTLRLAGRTADAIDALEKVLELDEANIAAMLELAAAHRSLGEPIAAAALLRRALILSPGNAEILTLLAVALREQGKLPEALACHDAALQIAPNAPLTHAQRALVLLGLGRFDEGWREYEWRWQCPEMGGTRALRWPQWDGAPLEGRTILVHAEQGLGDEVMFATCYADVIARAAHVVIICQSRLEQIFRRSFPRAMIVAAPRGREHLWQPPASLQIDVQIAAGSLPQHLRSSLASFPRQQQFLVPDPRLVEAWRQRFAQLGPGQKIGISWLAGDAPADKQVRSTSLDQWHSLLATPGVHWINLQHGDRRQEIAQLETARGIRIHHWRDADNLENVDQLAAQLAALDLVISVGNTTVHLSGGLGTPAWALLPHNASWRWLTETEETPWYASVRLIRQCRPGQWQESFMRVRQDLLVRVGQPDEESRMRGIGRPHWKGAGAVDRARQE